jgi:hypothetical protein
VKLQKIALAALLLICSLSTLAGCTEEQEDKAADAFIDKLLGNTSTPAKTEYVDVDITINLSVGKTPSQINSPFVAAYPQAVNLHAYRQKVSTSPLVWGQEFDVKDLEKWTDKDGKITFHVFLSRVYPDDVFYYVYKPSLYSWGLKITDPKMGPTGPFLNETMVTGITNDQIKNAKYDEMKNCFYLTWEENQYLGPAPSQSPSGVKSP